MVHVVRKLLGAKAQDTTRVLAQLDMTNAFNTLDRQHILAATRDLFPCLAPWVDWTYGQEAPLFIGHDVIGSQIGVQQGDPLGPLLFSFALHNAVARVMLKAPHDCPGTLDFVVFFLDEAIIAGTDDAVFCFCSALQAELSQAGLVFNAGKYVVTPHCWRGHYRLSRLFPRMGLEHEWLVQGYWGCRGSEACPPRSHREAQGQGFQAPREDRRP